MATFIMCVCIFNFVAFDQVGFRAVSIQMCVKKAVWSWYRRMAGPNGFSFGLHVLPTKNF